jgi:hypothetical protein
MALIEVAERLGVAGPGALPELKVVCHHFYMPAWRDSVPDPGFGLRQMGRKVNRVERLAVVLRAL